MKGRKPPASLLKERHYRSKEKHTPKNSGESGLTVGFTPFSLEFNAGLEEKHRFFYVYLKEPLPRLEILARLKRCFEDV